MADDIPVGPLPAYNPEDMPGHHDQRIIFESDIRSTSSSSTSSRSTSSKSARKNTKSARPEDSSSSIPVPDPVEVERSSSLKLRATSSTSSSHASLTGKAILSDDDSEEQPKDKEDAHVARLMADLINENGNAEDAPAPAPAQAPPPAQQNSSHPPPPAARLAPVSPPSPQRPDAHRHSPPRSSSSSSTVSDNEKGNQVGIDPSNASHATGGNETEEEAAVTQVVRRRQPHGRQKRMVTVEIPASGRQEKQGEDDDDADMVDDTPPPPAKQPVRGTLISAIDNEDANEDEVEEDFDLPPALKDRKTTAADMLDSDQENTDDDDIEAVTVNVSRPAFFGRAIKSTGGGNTRQARKTTTIPTSTQGGANRSSRASSNGFPGTQGTRTSTRRVSTDNPLTIGKTFEDDKSFIKAAAQGIMMSGEHTATINVVSAREEKSEGLNWLEVVCVNTNDTKGEGGRVVNWGCSVMVEAKQVKKGRKTVWEINKSNLAHCNDCIEADAKLVRNKEADFDMKWDIQYAKYKVDKKRKENDDRERRRSTSTAQDDSGIHLDNEDNDSANGSEDDDEEEDQLAEDGGAMDLDAAASEKENKPTITKQKNRARSISAKPSASTAARKKNKKSKTSIPQKTRSSRTISGPLIVNSRTRISDLGLSSIVEETLHDANFTEIGDLRKKDIDSDDLVEFVLRLRTFSRKSAFDLAVKQGDFRTEEEFDEFTELFSGAKKLEKYVLRCYGALRRRN